MSALVRIGFGALAWLAAASPARADIEGLACVADAQTIAIGGRSGPDGGCAGGVLVRLFGIAAVEPDRTCRRADREWPCGAEAMAALNRLVDGQHVFCAQVDRDPAGRIVTICRVDAREVNLHLVASGWAVALPQLTTAYVAAEAEARRERRGIWAADFEQLADWRQRHQRR